MKTALLSLALFFCLSAVSAQVLPADAFDQQLRQTAKPQLLDVRTPGEFGGGHLPNAQNIDYRNAAFRDSLTRLDKTQPVFVYCLSGGRSAQAAEVLRKDGFSQVYELQGGYLKWTGQQKPVEGVPAKSSVKATAMTSNELTKVLAANQLVLVDFYASWCAPCQKMLPIMAQLETKYAGKVTIVKVDADASKELMQAYQVDEIPTLLFIKKGSVANRFIGFQTQETLSSLFDENLVQK
jgi:thioredoxin 1